MSGAVLNPSGVVLKKCIGPCGIEKEFTDSNFYYYERQKKWHNKCKECVSKQRKKYREDNKEKVADGKLKYAKNNKEKISAKKRNTRLVNKTVNPDLIDKEKQSKQAYYEKNKDILLLKNAVYRQDNKEKIATKKKEYNERNKQKISDYKKQWAFENKEDIKSKNADRYVKNKSDRIAKQNDYNNKRIKNDPVFKLRKTFSRRILRDLKCFGTNKNGESILQYLPYTIAELRAHLESLWEPWMNWDNHGTYRRSGQRKWNIDHIIPQSLLPYDSMSHPNFLKCWALSNLRPLDAFENISKGAKI